MTNDLDYQKGKLEKDKAELAYLEELLTVEKNSAAAYLKLIQAEIGS